MKIVHIQYSMPPAGNACFRLHSAMLSNGIQSVVFNIKRSIVQNSNVVSPQKSVRSIIAEIAAYLHCKFLKRILKKGSYFFSPDPIIGFKISKEQIVRDADVIYLHWVAGGCITFKEIDRLASLGKPVIFFMHDMWDFTGGCHHSFECKGYETGCKMCPMLERKTRVASKQIQQKFKVFSKHPNIIFVSPSKWMADCARRSYALKMSNVYTISNIVDESVFKPIDKVMSRKILNLPLNKKIIAFGCQAGTTNPYKGWSYLREAMSGIYNEAIHILIYGVDYQKQTQEQIMYPITFLGPVYDETKLSLICNAADVFVSPSLAESFGLTFLENILCGTPVVGFNNTAVGEIVQTGKTGYLAENKNSADLRAGILEILSNGCSIANQYHYSSKEIIAEHISLLTQEAAK